ncbi:alpha/beta hydrolase [Bacillus sp. HMF5848]|uniref:alpha/beta fold hydrolase n=1 Tax=Bacillus sp. HMF5848 TaxID=2495421 RepID=UPI000F78DA38|nr:alpha/beta hydrolase [Bacillus sp. HMF5848]RSK26630.1 alpha/beta hydrolase [Bacillus sp. HMF5848]
MKKSKRSSFGVPYLHFGVGEPLVLIHGLGEIKEGWLNQFELEDQFELIIPDLRGHGQHKPFKDISIEHFASDIINLLKELRIQSAHICGLSMGGAVAQEIYRQAPSMCRSLLLVSTMHYVPKALGQTLSVLKHPHIKMLTSQQQKERAARLCLYSWKGDTAKNMSRYFNPDPDAFQQSLQACLKVNNLSLLPKIKVPTLVIGCQYDAIIPVWVQLWMHKLIPHSEFVIMRNCGHVAKIEAKDRFNSLIREFLTKQKQAAA